MTKIYKNKKSDKSLDMIFSILVLVIIATVVILLFLNTAHNIHPYPINSTRNFVQKQLTACSQECSNYKMGGTGSENAGVEYCTETYAFPDANKFQKNATYGVTSYCTDHVTCVTISKIAGQFGLTSPNLCTLTQNDCKSIIHKEFTNYGKTFIDSKYTSLMSNAPFGSCNLKIDPFNWMAVILSDDINNAFIIKNGTNIIRKQFYNENDIQAIGDCLNSIDSTTHECSNGGTIDGKIISEIDNTTTQIGDYTRYALSKYLSEDSTSTLDIKNYLSQFHH